MDITKMTEDNLEWGENWHGKEHSLRLVCVNNECKRSRGSYVGVEHSKLAIGVKKGFENESILTCEYPECFTKYWFHIDILEAEQIAQIHKSKLEEIGNL